MKNKFKKILVAVMLTIVGVCFTGCDWSNLSVVDKDVSEYLAQTVAKTTIDGETDLVISLNDLITAYNSYGYTYVQDDGLTAEEAIKKTLQKEIDRMYVVRESKEIFTNEVTNQEINTVWQQVYDYMNEQIADYETEVITDEGYTMPSTADDEETADTGVTKTAYKQKAKLVDGEIVMVEEEVSGNPDEELIGSTDDFYNGFMRHRNVSNQNISTKALSRFVKQLKLNEDGKNLSTVDSEVISRECERVYDIALDNFYIQKLENKYNYTNRITAADVLEKYKSMYRENYQNYSTNIENYYTDMQDSGAVETVVYHPNDEFHYVSHILIKYSDEQTAQIAEWDTMLSNGTISQEDYDNNISYIRTQLMTQARDENGEYYGEEKTASQVLSEIETAVNNTSSLTEKCETFNKLVYKYNEDEGIMNKNYNYVVGDTKSSMVDEFTDASRELFAEGKGNMSKLVYTEYGAHIILYTGDAQNLISYSDLDNVTLQDLAGLRLQSGEEKTMFDFVYDKLYDATSSFTNYQDNMASTLEHGAKITYYENVYKEMID